MAGRHDAARPFVFLRQPEQWCSASYSPCVSRCEVVPRQQQPASCPSHPREDDMPESVYKVIELIGTSKESWEKAATAAVSRAGKSLRDLRVAEVVKLDLQLDDKG